jgi:hypothetical protein
MNVALTTVYHDPQGRLYDQIVRVLPRLIDLSGGLAVQASADAYPRSLEHLANAGVLVGQEPVREPPSGIGLVRRNSIDLALKLDCPFILYCDTDRALHWAEHYPQELVEVARRICDHDFTVLGRTPRAFDTHPRIQRDTERIINHVFEIISGHAWDVGAGARGLSQRAAEAILAKCPDEEISTDVSWPLFLQRSGDFSQGYLETEGLEFETADRYGDEVARAGGLARWLDQLDADPQRWAQRLDLARIEVEAMIPYVQPGTNRPIGPAPPA